MITFQLFFLFLNFVSQSRNTIFLQKYHLFTREHLELIVLISHLCLDYWPDLKTVGVFDFKNFV